MVGSDREASLLLFVHLESLEQNRDIDVIEFGKRIDWYRAKEVWRNKGTCEYVFFKQNFANKILDRI